MIDVTLEFAGELWHAMPERALFRPALQTLYVADMHLGKAETFRAHAMPLPHGTTNLSLGRLAQAIARSGATRLVVLGDLMHARAGRSATLDERLQRWRDRHPILAIDMVRGNHDRHAGDPHPDLRIAVYDAPLDDSGIALMHHPPANANAPWLAGHIHPAVRLSGPARDSIVLPCFHWRVRGITLPAFGEFTGSMVVEPQPGDRLLVVAGDEVIEVASRD